MFRAFIDPCRSHAKMGLVVVSNIDTNNFCLSESIAKLNFKFTLICDNIKVLAVYYKLGIRSFISVVQTGVKSGGCAKKISHDTLLNSAKFSFLVVLTASKLEFG